MSLGYHYLAYYYVRSVPTSYSGSWHNISIFVQLAIGTHAESLSKILRRDAGDFLVLKSVLELLPSHLNVRLVLIGSIERRAEHSFIN